MAVLYVTEFETPSKSQTAVLPMVRGPKVADNNVAIGGTSTQSSAFNADTRIIRVHTDAICSIEIGANPTAAATSARMAANQTEYFFVTPGHKIAVITNT